MPRNNKLKKTKNNIDHLVKPLGYLTYANYLNSQSWLGFKEEYKFSGLPEECLGCGTDDYVLHHISYNNLGKETYADVIPLCNKCHFRIHKYLERVNWGVSKTDKALKIIFRWDNKTANSKFAAFSPYWKQKIQQNKESRIEKYVRKVMSNSKKKNEFYKLANDSLNVARYIADGYSAKDVGLMYGVSEAYVCGYMAKFSENF